MSETLDLNQEVKKRPTFLSVLCILTFIGSGWGIISSLVMQDAGLAAYFPMYYWVLILLNVGSLLGAVWMWQLKKNGLYVYTAASLIAIILMWVIVKGYIKSLIGDVEGISTGDDQLNSMLQNSGNALIESAMNLGLILGTIFPVLFIILYWVNAKHLK